MRLSLILSLLFIRQLCHGLVIDGYLTGDNDRFANHAGFIASAFDHGGVGISSDSRWATLIAPNVFLTADHYAPGAGKTVTFYRTNDPSGPSVTRIVTSTRQRVGTSDLQIVTLDLPVPEGYAFYSFATESLPGGPNWNSYPYKDEEVFHYGRSPAAFPLSQDMAVGKNVVDTRVLNQMIESPTANGPAIICQYNTLTGTIPYETAAQPGDSGAPMFWDAGGGNLRLIGIAWFITQNTVTGETTGTGFTPVGDYAEAVDSFLDANALPYQPLAPSGFSASRVGASQIDLGWQDNSAVETAYQLERAEAADGPWTPLASLPADTESFSDTTAPQGDVFYRLRALNDSASDPATASVLTPYSLWAAGFDWGSADQSPAGDANNDGISNLAAYSMDLPPLDPVPAEALPYLEHSDGWVEYFYRKNPEAPDISFVLESTDNLITADWQDVPVDGVTVTETDTGEVEGARLMRIRMPAANVSDPGFFRLRISSSDLP